MAIHAKIYVLYPDNFNQYTGGIAITGSSNLSCRFNTEVQRC